MPENFMIPSPVGGMGVTAGGLGNNPVTASQVNSFRIAAVVDRLAMNMQQLNQTKNDSAESFNLCLSLARGIDFSIANQEIPSRAPDLPSLLKQVCQCTNDALLQAAIMVLMISVKNACQSGWFSDKDSEELIKLAHEMASNFCTSVDFNTEPSTSNPIIATIMSRFYPRMKMGQILTFLEVKPGYGAYVSDFRISKHLKHSSEEKIRLFVAQADSTEISSCLVSPPQVNFLLNGKGVDRRNSVFMDTGPQIPTHVTHLLKYGSNLLQAVGQFDGNYIIAVALMTEMSAMENPALQDYVQPTAVIVDPDSEIIEGPSRISLNCPISFRRIRTPAKGHSCKHLQCFDFNNYMDINSKRPSWRCPHCNHHCCFTEIRIDQNMVKVLKEVGENVNDVLISSDGSWKAIMESDDHSEKRQDKFPILDQDEPTQPHSTNFSNAPSDLMDLTEIDDAMDSAGACEAEDTKVFLNNSAYQSSIQNMTSGPHLNNTNEVHQNTSAQMEDDFWSGIYLSTFQSGLSNSMPDARIGGIHESTPSSMLSSPVLTDTISPVTNSGAVPVVENVFLENSAPQNEITSPTALQLQQFQFGNYGVNNEYGRSLLIPRHISRTPIAVQALPAQTPTTLSQRLRNSTGTLMQNSPLAASQTSALPALGASFNANSSNNERQQQFSRSQPSAPQLPQMSSQQHQHSNTQQDHSFIPGQPTRQVSSHHQAVTQAQGAYQKSSGRQSDLQKSSPRQTSNLRMPYSMSQSAGRFQQSAKSGTFFQSQIDKGGSQGVSSQAVGGSDHQHHRSLAAAQRAAQVTRIFQTSRPAPFSGNSDSPVTSSVGDRRGILGSTPQSVPRSDVALNLTADQDWRPTGRMRGSLSGQAYSAALSQYISPPTQPRAPTNLNSSALNPSTQLQILMANRAAMAAVNNNPSTGLASMSSASAAFPPHSTGMQ